MDAAWLGNIIGKKGGSTMGVGDGRQEHGGTPPERRGAEAACPGVPGYGSGTDAEHLRLLFDNMLEGYAYCHMIFDDQGREEDFVYVDVNRAFARLTGLTDVVGKRVTEVIPDIKESNPELLMIYGRVARSGEPEQFEVSLDQLGIVLDISVFRPEPDHFVAVFEDITERKHAEHKLEELVRFLEFRVEQKTNDLAEALRILDRPPGSKGAPKTCRTDPPT